MSELRIDFLDDLGSELSRVARRHERAPRRLHVLRPVAIAHAVRKQSRPTRSVGSRWRIAKLRVSDGPVTRST